jgi:hypothetical protein
MNASGIEHLQERLRAFVAQQQGLCEPEANRDELESNRLELACRQTTALASPHRSSPLPRRTRRLLTKCLALSATK